MVALLIPPVCPLSPMGCSDKLGAPLGLVVTCSPDVGRPAQCTETARKNPEVEAGTLTGKSMGVNQAKQFDNPIAITPRMNNLYQFGL